MAPHYYHIRHQLTPVLGEHSEKYFVLKLLETLPAGWKVCAQAYYGDKHFPDAAVKLYLMSEKETGVLNTNIETMLPIASIYFIAAFRVKKQQQYNSIRDYIRMYVCTNQRYNIVLTNVTPAAWLPGVPQPISTVLKDERIPWKKLKIKRSKQS